jgi:hypothetical protein
MKEDVGDSILFLCFECADFCAKRLKIQLNSIFDLNLQAKDRFERAKFMDVDPEKWKGII